MSENLKKILRTVIDPNSPNLFLNMSNKILNQLDQENISKQELAECLEALSSEWEQYKN